MSVGKHQADAMQRITGSTVRTGVTLLTSATGAFSGKNASTTGISPASASVSGYASFDFDSGNSMGARVSSETRGASTRVACEVSI